MLASQHVLDLCRMQSACIACKAPASFAQALLVQEILLGHGLYGTSLCSCIPGMEVRCINKAGVR